MNSIKAWGVNQPEPIRFTVYGTPRPQGSKRHVGHGVMVEQSKHLMPWRQQLSGVALSLQVPRFAKDTLVAMVLDFYFARPKTAKRRGMTVAPDVDKLTRAVFDSMKGILLHDDSQVVEVLARKHYGNPERVEIQVSESQMGKGT